MIEPLLRAAQTSLSMHGIDSARLDAEVLLAQVLGVDRVYLYAHPQQVISQQAKQHFESLIKRRSAHEPVAYLCGTREFFGRDFIVNPHVLIPRPETEHIIEYAVSHCNTKAPLCILDMCTGSGVLAITLAYLFPHAQIIATDLSAQALHVAQCNMQQHNVSHRIKLYQGDTWQALPEYRQFDLIVSNPPYIAVSEYANLDATVKCYEPSMALLAGADGLDVFKKIVQQLSLFLHTNGLFLCEIGATQAANAMGALPSGFSASVQQDLHNHDRFIVIQNQVRVAAKLVGRHQ